MSRISKKNWALIWILGLAGQLCWNVENQWFNTFVYDKIAPNPVIISWMVGLSAAVTTFATNFIGTLGDRRGRRKPYIAFGYIMWGIFTIVFGIGEFLPKSSVLAAAIFVVAIDAIMSFFGSVGYDAAFSAWTTDISDESNRGEVGGAFATMPVIATIVGSVVAGYIIKYFDFFGFFIIIGLLVTTIGVTTLFLLEDAPNLKSNKDKDGFLHQFFSVFNFKTVKENKELFWVFIIMMVYFIAFNVYFPYVTIYFVNYLGLEYGITGLIQGISLLIAVMLTIPVSKHINSGKNTKVISIALMVNILGLVVISTRPPIMFLGVGMLLTGIGYVIILQTITAWFKNLYPEEQRGQFEGVKQIFFVCIPMIIGPNISSIVIHTWGVEGIVNDKVGMIPNEMLFIISGVITLLTYLPLVPAGKLLNRRKEKECKTNL